jgi:drug/metabolite transporter (DMT)-like permease
VKGRILAAFAVVYLVWGSTYLGIRVAVATLPPFLLAGTRFVAAGLLLYAWARVRGARAPGRREWLASLAIGILLVAGANAVVGWAEQRVPSGLAALIVAGMPLWVALFQRVAPDAKPLGAARVTGLLVGFAGLVLLLSGGGAAGACPGGPGCLGKHASPGFIPMLALVGASISWALGSVLSRRVPMPGDKMLASAMSMLAGGIVTLGVGALAGELAAFEPARVSVASVAAWAYLVVFGSMLGFTCFTWLVSVVDPTRVATYAYVNPVVALLLGWSLAGEPLGERTLVATPVILLGLVLVLRPEAVPLPGRRSRAEVAA